MTRALIESGPALTIYEAAQLWPEWHAALLACPEGLDVDLSNVSEIDSAGLQLLLMLQKEAMQQGRNLQFCQPGIPVRQLLALLNLADALNLAETAQRG